MKHNPAALPFLLLPVSQFMRTAINPPSKSLTLHQSPLSPQYRTY